MALVKCPDCGREVSPRAEACPHCGCPGRYFPERVKAGGSYVLGRWGGEPIEWRVLAVEGDRALLITEKAIDCKPYHLWCTRITWEQCGLRAWLNGEFYQRAFDASERGMIAETFVRNDDNPYFGTPGGPAARDRVFCLSIAEAERYFANDEDRVCHSTATAKGNGIREIYGACDWWLRSPGSHANDAAGVFDGGVSPYGWQVNNDGIGVRPALWLSL